MMITDENDIIVWYTCLSQRHGLLLKREKPNEKDPDRLYKQLNFTVIVNVNSLPLLTRQKRRLKAASVSDLKICTQVEAQKHMETIPVS